MSAGNSTVTDITSSSETSTTISTEPASSTTTTTSLIETTTTSSTTSTTESTPTSTSTSETPSSTTTLSTTTTTIGVIETSTVDGTQTTVTVTITSTDLPPVSDPTSDTSLTSSATTTSAGTVETGGAKTGNNIGSGLSGGALIAVAVIVPVVILAVVAVGLVLYFKKRKSNRNGPTKGSIAGGMIGGGVAPPDDRDGAYEMNEPDGAGYRGWGSTVRGPKTTVAGSSGYPMSSVGKAVSDGGYSNPASVGPPGYTGNGNDMYTGVNTPASPVFPDSTGLLAVDRAAPSPAFTENSTIGAMPTFDSHNSGGLNRGISNASSNYSAMTHSDQSDFDHRQSQQYYGPNAQDYDAAYFSNGPNMYYDDTSNPPPVIRDVQARRNTRIETPTSAHFPQQGSSGIAQNF